MGVSYLVVGLGDLDADELEQMRDWFREEGVEVPAGAERAHLPSMDVVESVARSFESDGYTVGALAEQRRSHVWVERRSPSDRNDVLEGATISCVKSEGERLSWCFEKGDPHLNIRVLERITQRAGPLVMIPDTGERPVIVTPGSTADDVLAEWE